MKNPFSLLRNLLPGKRNPWAQPPGAAPAAIAPQVAPGPRYLSEAAPTPEEPAAGLTIDLPLTAVIYLLPSHLQARLCSKPGEHINIAIPLQEVLAQLSQGDVHITFGQLRQAAPDLFTPEADEDATLVQLPYAELASRCDPALLNHLQQAAAAPRPEPLPVPPSRPVAPAPRNRPVAAPAPGVRPNLIAANRQVSPAPAPKPAVRPAALPSRSTSVPTPAQPASSGEVLLVDLAALAESWPEAIHNEIEQLNLTSAQVALPREQVGAGLKQGRLVFRWETLLSWMQSPVTPGASSFAQTELELPLGAVAPLFLARERPLQRTRAEVELDEEIPGLFEEFTPGSAGAAPAEPAAVPEPRTAPAAAPEPAPARPVAAVAKPSVTPQELVCRAIELSGVSGALVTLPDGLLVASRLPERFDADQLSAFLPQIFTKLGRFAQDLQLGELSALEFLVSNVPWKVFRLSEVFFVVIGRSGEALPSPALSSLAAELGQP